MSTDEFLLEADNDTTGSQPRVVLVVEDDPSLRGLLLDVLKVAGFQAKPAENGRTCLELASSMRVSCILLDLRLPDIDGFAVLRRLHRGAATANIPVVIVSGFVSADDQELAIELGAVAYITKPYHIPDLITVVRSITKK